MRKKIIPKLIGKELNANDEYMDIYEVSCDILDEVEILCPQCKKPYNFIPRFELSWPTCSNVVERIPLGHNEFFKAKCLYLFELRVNQQKQLSIFDI